MTTDAPWRTGIERSGASPSPLFLIVPGAESTRRLEISFVRDSATGDVSDDPIVGIRFADLAEWWHSDTDGMSLDRERLEHPAYKRILDLGKPVLPHVLADLRDRHGHWFHALRHLTGDESVDAVANGSMRRARDAWLRWGKTKKLI